MFEYRSKYGKHVSISLLFIVACYLGSTYAFTAYGIAWFPFRLLTLCAVPVIVITRPSKSHDSLLKFGIFFLLSMVFMGLTSLLWSPDPHLGLQTWGILTTGVIFVILVIRVFNGNKKIIDIWMLSWALVLILTSFIGVYEFVTGNYIRHIDDLVLPSMLRLMEGIGWNCPRTFWQNYNNYAFVNAISVLSISGWALGCRGRNRFLGISAVAIGTFMVLLSYSRAAIGGLGIGGLVVLFCMWHTSGIRLNNRKIVFTLVILIVFVLSHEKIEFVGKLFSSVIEKAQIADDSYRTGTYTEAIRQGVLISLGFGRGLGASTEIIEGKSYHHHMLEVLAELGLWVFICYITLFIALALRFWKNIQKGIDPYWSAGLLASCVAFPLLCAGPSGIFGEGVFWLWMAVLIAFACLPRETARAVRRGGGHE
jgi:O-antigen ligase